MSDDGFSDFWAIYPRKVAKAEARKAWAQTASIRPDTDTLIKAVLSHCKTEQWMKSNGAFIPHAATWLRGERWEDVYEVSLPDVVNDKPWHETATGIVRKGQELGISSDQFEHFQDFRTAVMRAAMKAA
jgi:hypothetical protein